MESLLWLQHFPGISFTLFIWLSAQHSLWVPGVLLTSSIGESNTAKKRQCRYFRAGDASSQYLIFSSEVFSSPVYFTAGGEESETYWMFNLICGYMQNVPISRIINTKHKQMTSLLHTCKQTSSVGWRVACTEDGLNITVYSQQMCLQAEHVWVQTSDHVDVLDQLYWSH